MSFDLTDKNIKDTFQNLLQKTGSDGRLYDLVGNQVRLWKTRDQNNQFHWWCETRNGETIDLTSEQYSENNIEVPSNGRAAKMKESGRILSFTSYKKKVDSLLEIIQNF